MIYEPFTLTFSGPFPSTRTGLEQVLEKVQEKGPMNSGKSSREGQAKVKRTVKWSVDHMHSSMRTTAFYSPATAFYHPSTVLFLASIALFVPYVISRFALRIEEIERRVGKRNLYVIGRELTTRTRTNNKGVRG